MSNWCNTSMYFYGEESIVTDLHKKVTKWLNAKELIYKSDFGIPWLGNVLAYTFGKDFVKEHEYDANLNFRGWIQDLDSIIEYDTEKKVWLFTIGMESSWYPHLKMWYLVLEKLYGKNADIHIAYMSDEPGMRSYHMYDPDHIIYDTEKIYHVDAWDANYKFGFEECVSEYEEEELIATIKDFFNITCTGDMLDDLDNLNEMIQKAIKDSGESDDDCGFYISKYKVAKKEDY